MSGTVNHLNRSIQVDIEDLKKLQSQRNKLDKIASDYRSKQFLVESLMQENNSLKQMLHHEQKEKSRLDGVVGRDLDDALKDDSIVQHELELSKLELEKYRVYADEIEKNNQNWRKECERQSLTLETLVQEAEELNSKLRDAEDDL